MNISSPATVLWSELEEGYKLPVAERDITAALIVGGAISATHDYEAVHHDYHAARKAAAEDVFMNILTTNGLIGKYLTDWTGPTGEIKKITLRLAVPNYPGDKMTMTGVITKKYEEDGNHLVEVEFCGKNSLGNHAIGKAIMALHSERG
ncbi:hotdog family protein [Bacillus testis]|uniref:hypothetical protein n=1 Tax=Bacillus testis TaxID=1622072 RepID=UPI00067E806C|nr:hypothetical protein [Bacillus testis]